MASTEVLLLEPLYRKGTVGDIVTVKMGFARNFLLPRRIAVRANTENKIKFESIRQRLNEENSKRLAEAHSLSSHLAGTEVVVQRHFGDSGRLYGSVTAQDVSAALHKRRYSISANQVILDKRIKDAGSHTVRIRLHPELETQVDVVVVRAEEDFSNRARSVFDEDWLWGKVVSEEGEITKRFKTVVSEEVQPFKENVESRFDQSDAKIEQIDKKFDKLLEAVQLMHNDLKTIGSAIRQSEETSRQNTQEIINSLSQKPS